MSGYDRVRGTLKPVQMTEEQAESLCKMRDIDLYEDTWIETLGVESDDYVFIKGHGLFEIIEFHREDPYESWCNIQKENGLIKFDAYYYDGGCWWGEMLKDELGKERNE